jgi:hypothetical protein
LRGRSKPTSPDRDGVAHSAREQGFSRQRHADGGEAAIDTLRLRIEVGLIAHSAQTTRQARSVFQAIRGLAEARAKHLAGQVPDEVVEACRRAERAFATVVRAELGSPDLDW